MFSTHFALYFELFRFYFYLLSFSEGTEASVFFNTFALYFELFRFSFYLLSFSEGTEASVFLYIHLL
jgi:hypothetical protein